MKKILIADDEIHLRFILKELLTPLNYLICEAGNGEEALEIALREKPDVILLDVSMPKMSGFEVLKKLKQNSSNSKIIMVSAKTQKTDIDLGLSLGADHYITKPFDLIRLSNLIEEVLK